MSQCIDPRWEELIGAYLLGACSPDEAEGMREHLAACASCARAAADLAPAREALLSSVAPVTPPASLKDRVMRDVRADAALFDAARADAPRREPGFWGRLRGRLAAPIPLATALACSLALLVGGAVIGGVLLGDGDSGTPGSRVLVGQVDPAQAPGARARIVERGGTRQLVVEGMPAAGRGRVYQVWLRNGDGTPRPSGALFAVNRSGRGEAPVPPQLGGADQVLVSNEPDGGSPQPTRDPVVVVPV